MLGIVGPHAADLARRGEARDVVNVAVGLVGVDAVLDPDDLLDAEVLAEKTLDLLLGVLRVAVLVQKAHLGHDDGALAVAVERAALEDVVVGTIAVHLLDLGDLKAQRGVLVPREVQTVDEAAVGVEVEVAERELALAVHEERRARIAQPGVVVLHEQHAHILILIEELAHRGPVLCVHAHGDGLEARDGADDLGEDLLRGLRAVAPHVGTVRPENPGALLLLVLAGHPEAVGLGRRLVLVDSAHSSLLSCQRDRLFDRLLCR